MCAPSLLQACVPMSFEVLMWCMKMWREMKSSTELPLIASEANQYGKNKKQRQNKLNICNITHSHKEVVGEAPQHARAHTL